MKQIFYLLLLLTTTTFYSCRKDRNQQTFKQYDQTQIQNYIAANGITGMVRDTVGGDTTGIYYKIIQQGSTAQPTIGYADIVSVVYTIKTFDGLFSQQDTIENHFYDFVGHIPNATPGRPYGLELAILHNLKYPGTTMRVLIPSHLAFGVHGYGSGSTTQTNVRISGNQCLDFYVNVVSVYKYAATPASADTSLLKFNTMQASYDDKVIKNYMADSSFTGYTKTASGLYYKILSPYTSLDVITLNSTITAEYTGQLLNGTTFDAKTSATLAESSQTISGIISGVKEVLLLPNVSVGTKISFWLPSALGYGVSAQSTIPVNSCLRFTYNIATVTP